MLVKLSINALSKVGALMWLKRLLCQSSCILISLMKSYGTCLCGFSDYTCLHAKEQEVQCEATFFPKDQFLLSLFLYNPFLLVLSFSLFVVILVLFIIFWFLLLIQCGEEG